MSVAGHDTPLSVLHVNDYVAGGGAEVLIARLIEVQREAGIRSELCTIEDVPGHRRSALSYIANRRAADALAKRLAVLRPDVVHVHNVYHELSPSILGPIAAYRDHAQSPDSAAVVMSCHDHHLLCPNAGLTWFQGDDHRVADMNQLHSIRYLLSRRWDRRGWTHSTLKVIQHVLHYRVKNRRAIFDDCLVPSRSIARGLSSLGRPNRITPTPAPQWHPAQKQDSETLRLVFAGRIEPEKGLLQFLEALGMARDLGVDARLDALGEGSDRARCEARCRALELADHATFHGWVSRDEVMKHIGAAHAVVMPSLVPEAGGLAVLEAFALQTNAIATDHGGAAESICDAGIGIRYQPDSTEDAARAIVDARDALHAGRLNDFDASGFLSQRTETIWAQSIAASYIAALTARRTLNAIEPD